jgi:galactokinase
MEDLSPKRNRIREIFRNAYGREPRVFRAPGRVNFIGEHTDYNEGFVLPFAIDRETLMAGASRSDTKINIRALDVNDSITLDLREAGVKRRGNWVDYVEGTVRCLQKRFDLRNGADIIFTSTVPIGAGLSSSAALEVSMGYAILSVNGLEVDGRELAFAAQDAEHEFVGARTGIMDQFTSVFGRHEHALLLDCRSVEAAPIPLKSEGAALIVCDTRVKHRLASSEYNTRRAECEEGVELLSRDLSGIRSLRDVTLEDFQTYEKDLPENISRRCRHVITEDIRTQAAAEALVNADLSAAGELMFQSHASLRDDYEVSCPELDTLVETARKIPGVYGARMTGGGFGGCTVNLIEDTALEGFKDNIRREYAAKFGFAPDIYVVRPSDGASEIT